MGLDCSVFITEGFGTNMNSTSDHTHNLLEMLAQEYDRGFQDGVATERYRHQLEKNAKALYTRSEDVQEDLNCHNR